MKKEIFDLLPGAIVYVEEFFSECSATKATFVRWLDPERTRAMVKIGFIKYKVYTKDLTLTP